MNYTGIACPVCGERMTEDDDIVVCPECATPQHRECWKKNGHCANEPLHVEGFVWRQNPKKAEEPKGQGNEPVEPPGDTDTKICPECGSENPPDSLHCGNCGSLFSSKPLENRICPVCGTENGPNDQRCKNCNAPLSYIINNGFFRENPFLADAGIDPEEKIGEHTASELAFYVQSSSKRYIPKFRKFANGKKLSFNWAAFFFSPYWFFGRKLYKAGIFVLAIFASFSLFTSSIATDFYEAYIEATAPYYNEESNGQNPFVNLTEEETANVLNEIYDKTHDKATRFAEVMGISFLIRFIIGLCADKLYYKKTNSLLSSVKEGVTDENMKKLVYARRGGFSFMNFATAIIGYNLLIQLLVYTASLFG